MRLPVDLPKAYRLLNHGPTVLVSAAHEGRRNAMAAAWAMPLDFDPPKVAVVLDKATCTRQLVQASGDFCLSVPRRAQADLVYTLGSVSGHALDKAARLPLHWIDGSATSAPLVDGCVAWLECRLLPEPGVQDRHDLFLGEVVAAWADERVFRDGRWHYGPGDDDWRTLHHIAAGAFFSASDPIQARSLLD